MGHLLGIMAVALLDYDLTIDLQPISLSVVWAAFGLRHPLAPILNNIPQLSWPEFSVRVHTATHAGMG